VKFVLGRAVTDGVPIIAGAINLC